MAVIATDQCTLSVSVDVDGVETWYMQVAASSPAPAKPTVADPTSLGWSTTEPGFDAQNSKKLYTCQKTTLTDGTFMWGPVQLSSSYTGASTALNTANAAAAAVADVQTLVRQYGQGVLVCKTGQDIGALVNADGSFDVVGVSWSGGVPTAESSLATFGGDGARIGREDERHATVTDAALRFVNSADAPYFNVGAKEAEPFEILEEIPTTHVGSTFDVELYGVYSVVSAAYTNADKSVSDDIDLNDIAVTTSQNEGGMYVTTITVPYPLSSTFTHVLLMMLDTNYEPYFAFTDPQFVPPSEYGTYSSSFGMSQASGDYAHAEGIYSYAYGPNSHAEGFNANALGRYSHAQNEGTIARSESQTALGTYNVEDANGTYVVIVGNGGSGSSRSNALTVDWSGNVCIDGDVQDMSGNQLYADASHEHSAADITSGTLGLARGGTGATTAAAARANLAVPGLGTTNTFTASQVIKDGSIDRDGSAPSADDWSDRYACYYDKDGELLADWRCVQRASSNRIESIFRCWREVSGTAKENRITVGVNSDGSAYYWMSDAGAFRTALGLGTAATHATDDYAAASHNHAAADITSGTLGLARGGTGQSLSAAPSMLTNLASTTAASPFAASPRPGITGTLGKGNGGTGKTNTDTTYYGAKSLFSGTATTGTVTLSETAANYSMLLIQYRDNDSNYSSKLIISPNSKKVVLDMVYGVSGVGNLKSRTVTISGTSITTVSGSAMDAAHNDGAGTTNHIYITQVWGWK